MKPPITAAQAMSHPVVFETVNSLGQMAERLCAKVDALTKERDALTERVKALTPTLTPILCDKCGIETPDPWHSSEGANKHIHTCDACHAQQVAVPATGVPLSDEQIESLREKTFSTGNPYCPVDNKSMRKAARAIEAHHGIGDLNAS